MHTAFLFVTAVIVAAGIKGGIERFSKVMMPLLFFIVLGIVAIAVALMLFFSSRRNPQLGLDEPAS